MALATYMKAGRRGMGQFVAEVDGASTPITIGKLLTCTIGNGNAPEFTDPLNPPAVDPDDEGLRGVALTNGTKSNPTVQYLQATPDESGAIQYGGEFYDAVAGPTDLVLFTWLFAPSDAVGEWREILFTLSRSNLAFMKIHPVGSDAGWQTKTNSEERPVRLLLEF